MSEFIEIRKREFVKHFLKVDKLLKKVIPFAGQVSGVLGIVSVILGRDVDVVGQIIDQVLDPILSEIPVLGPILVSEDKQTAELDNPYWESGFTGGARNEARRRYNNAAPATPSRESMGRKATGASITMLKWGLILGVPFLILFVFLPGTVIGDYGGVVGQNIGDQYLPGMSTELAPLTHGIRGLGAEVACFARGPSCYFERTQRPESKKVGRTYMLEIDNFEVGRGGQVNVGWEDPDYAIPVSFSLYNPRYSGSSGITGIAANNVSYRIRVISTDRGLNNPHCDTDWVPVDAYEIREDAEGDWSGNDIYPGTAATEFLRLSENTYGGDALTLEECDMLQPARSETTGEHRTVMLDVKYDYSSPTTLNFPAMSLQNLDHDLSITQEQMNSEAPDTPARSSLTVHAPVLYDDDQLGMLSDDETANASQPFDIIATLNMDEFNMRYSVNDLIVEKSSQVEIYPEREEQCSFEDTGDGILELKEREEKRITGEEGEDWYDIDRPPPRFGCDLRLQSPDNISPTGETLTMGVDTNYTVAVEERMGNFGVLDERCGTEAGYLCPALVTRQYAQEEGNGGAVETSSDGNWKTVCDGLDAESGCSVLRGPEREDGRWSRTELTGESEEKFDEKLERGEVAVDPVALAQDHSSFVKGPALQDRNVGEVAVGIDQDDWNDIVLEGEDFFIISVPGATSRFEEGVLCDDVEEGINDEPNMVILGYTSRGSCDEDSDNGGLSWSDIIENMIIV